MLGYQFTSKALRRFEDETIGAIAVHHRLMISNFKVLSYVGQSSFSREDLLRFQHEAWRPVLPFQSLLVDPQHTLTKEIL